MAKILIVDDNKNIAFLLKSFLEEIDYDVIVSHNGIDALEKVKSLKPDIMILDLLMEGIDGMEVLRRIRLFNKSIGIIVVSAVVNEDIAKEALAKGADEYITKPIDYNYLSESILFDLVMRKKE
ncbi:MAG: response regulator [Candidatus Scalindua sp.]|nr:response regulator [Candidatus Scalindua sp.]MBT5304245.1 response regulator [Candidatus Scalindua sp.]MBT6049063.1 response regulator [Candidatus Scalindua sp.]MBT6226007.1 response regulator [Candidatus Scalindua sp.]MBT6564726.1 response regulator [Candidatus Scalindua sp.]